jgi:hypothetical protein
MREALAKHGLTFIDRYGSPRARPEAAIDAGAWVHVCLLDRVPHAETPNKFLDERRTLLQRTLEQPTDGWGSDVVLE